MAQPYLALDFTLLAFVTVIVGGLGSFLGRVDRRVTIGVTEAVAALLFAPSMMTALSYALLMGGPDRFSKRILRCQRNLRARRDLTAIAGGVALFAAFGVFGALSNAYFISLLTIVFLFAFIGQSWSLMLGLGGQLSIRPRSVRRHRGVFRSGSEHQIWSQPVAGSGVRIGYSRDRRRWAGMVES